MKISVVILAAGQGARMRSALPKVLHPVAGIPILERIVSTVSLLSPDRIVVVYGHHGDILKNAFKTKPSLIWTEQKEQRGTGHAVLQAVPQFGTADKVLIVYGDVPLISIGTLQKLINATKDARLGFVTVKTKDPAGLGRVIRNDQGKVVSVVEEKDATPEQKNISEINTGILCVDKERLSAWLPKLQSNNTQGEYYLTDIIRFASNEGLSIVTVSPEHEFEVLGVNDKIQLSILERRYQQHQAEELMRKGVRLLDPARFDLRGELSIGEDVVIDVNVIIEGKVRLGNGVYIGPNVILKHSEVHDGVQILANSLVEGTVVHAGAVVGPFARIRPGTELGVNARVGNFVEVKNAIIGPRSKVNHLSYIGDASLGQGVNIGAGTITCNYDGKNKHQTTIGDNVFIGSDTQLIAPVRIGNGATVGAGTTVVRDVEANQLVHNRIEQRTVKNWTGREDE